MHLLQDTGDISCCLLPEGQSLWPVWGRTASPQSLSKMSAAKSSQQFGRFSNTWRQSCRLPFVDVLWYHAALGAEHHCLLFTLTVLHTRNRNTPWEDTESLSPSQTDTYKLTVFLTTNHGSTHRCTLKLSLSLRFANLHRHTLEEQYLNLLFVLETEQRYSLDWSKMRFLASISNSNVSNELEEKTSDCKQLGISK